MTPIDLEKYLPITEDWDMIEQERIELLEELWKIMQAFVYLSWNGDSVSIFEYLRLRDQDLSADSKFK